jgi:hypothetical protein
LCIDYGKIGSDPNKDVLVCSTKCSKSTECGNGCCNGAVNSFSASFCAPLAECVSSKITPACRACLETSCANEIAACRTDSLCDDCLAERVYVSSTECLGNAAVSAAFRCGYRACRECATGND